MEKKELVRRLALPREVFRKAQTEIKSSGTYSGGFATSSLQDAVESFLRVVAEHGGIGVNASVSFDKLVDEVGKNFSSVAAHKAALSRLNKARVMFKHHSMRVENEDALVFFSAVKTFLTDVSNDVLELDFWSVSLAQAVGHQRTKNMLESAESAYQEGKYGDSIIASAKALAVYDSGERRLDKLLMIANVREDQVALRTALLELGVRYEDYARYKMIAPSALMSLDGSFSGGGIVIRNNSWIYELDSPVRREQLLESRGQEWVKDAEEKAKEAADFCIWFVVDWVLRIQDRFPIKSESFSEEGFVLVEKECDLMVNLRDDEVIRRVSVGEKLSKVDHWIKKENGDFVCVLQDGDKAFVRKDCVRLVSEGE